MDPLGIVVITELASGFGDCQKVFLANSESWSLPNIVIDLRHFFSISELAMTIYRSIYSEFKIRVSGLSPRISG